MVENMGNDARRAAKKSQSGGFGLRMVYHAISLTSQVHTEFDRPLVAATATSRSIGGSAALPSCFDAAGRIASVGEEMRNKIADPNPDWPATNAPVMRACPMRTLLMVKCAGD